MDIYKDILQCKYREQLYLDTKTLFNLDMSHNFALIQKHFLVWVQSTTLPRYKDILQPRHEAQSFLEIKMFFNLITKHNFVKVQRYSPSQKVAKLGFFK